MQLNNLNIAVLGAGRSGRAAARLATEAWRTGMRV